MAASRGTRRLWLRPPGERVSQALAAKAVAAMAIAVAYVLTRVQSADTLARGAGVGLALAIAVGGFLRPLVAIGGLLALVPYQFQIAVGPLLTGTNEIAVVAVALLLLPHARWASTPRALRWCIAAIVVGGASSAVTAVDPPAALWGATRWLAIGVIALAAFSLVGTRYQQAPRVIAAVVSCGTIGVGIFAVLQNAGVTAIVGTPYLVDRIDSTFGYYTNFAGFMALGGVLGLGLAIDRATPVLLRVVGAAAASFAALSLVISLSRGGVLAAGVSAVALVVLLGRSPRVLAIGLVAPLVALAVVFAAPGGATSAISQRISDPLSAKGGDDQRFAIQDAALTALATHPNGLGYANFASYVLDTSGDPLELAFAHGHQTFLQLGLDSGWLGFAGFIGFLLVPLGRAARAALAGRLTVLGAAFASALCGVVAQGLFDYLLFEISYLLTVVALVTGVWFSLASPDQERSPPASG